MRPDATSRTGFGPRATAGCVVRHTCGVGDAAVGRVSYRAVLAIGEFRALVMSQSLSILGDQVARIAIALLVYARSGSALAASATYACSYLTYLLAGPFLASLGDRYPRREIMLGCDVARALLVALLLVGLPLWAVFAVLVLVGLLAPPFDSARGAMLPEVLPGEAYTTGSAVIGALSQAGQVLGFLLGGGLVALLGVRGALLVDALTFVLSAAAVLVAVRRRPVPPRTGARPTLLSDTVAGVGVVLRHPALRYLLSMGLLVAAVGIPAEGLAVAVAAEQGHGSLAVGLLTAAQPAGFLVGSALLLRLAPARRLPLIPYLVGATCLPLLATPFAPWTWLVVVLWVVSGAAGAVQVVVNAGYVERCPPAVRARAFGVGATGIQGVQGLLLLVGGALAELLRARVVVALLALAGLVLVPLVARWGAAGLPTDSDLRPQGPWRTRRVPT